MKTCNKCKLEKDHDQFSKGRNYCKVCANIYNKIYYDKNKEREKRRRKDYYSKNRDKELKNLSFRRKNNPKSYREKDRIDYQKRKNYLAEYNKRYREENRLYFREKRKQYRLSKKNDILYNFYNTIRISILKSFKRVVRKDAKTEEIIGCSFDELIEYFESKFESWMNWSNRGLYNGNFEHGWDIDHIIPISTAKSQHDIIRLNHYTNLQPLCSKINRDIKRNKIIQPIKNPKL